MFPSFNPAGAGSATATVTVARCDSNNVIEKSSNDNRKGDAERFSRLFDRLVWFTRVWGVLTSIGEYFLCYCERVFLLKFLNRKLHKLYTLKMYINNYILHFILMLQCGMFWFRCRRIW